MEKFRAVFTTAVHLAIAEARMWYRQVSAKTVRAFNKSISDAVESVLDGPEHFSVRVSILRRINLKAFPYAFYFFIHEDRKQIVFTSFFHVKMNMPYSDTEGPEIIFHEP